MALTGRAALMALIAALAALLLRTTAGLAAGRRADRGRHRRGRAPRRRASGALQLTRSGDARILLGQPGSSRR